MRSRQLAGTGCRASSGRLFRAQPRLASTGWTSGDGHWLTARRRLRDLMAPFFAAGLRHIDLSTRLHRQILSMLRRSQEEPEVRIARRRRADCVASGTSEFPRPTGLIVRVKVLLASARLLEYPQDRTGGLSYRSLRLSSSSFRVPSYGSPCPSNSMEK